MEGVLMRYARLVAVSRCLPFAAVRRRLVLAVVAAMAVLGGSLALTGASALAYRHILKGEFGSFEHPTGVAVDETSGNVFVANGSGPEVVGPEVVDVFGEAGGEPAGGAPTTLTGEQTPAKSFDFGREPVGVAVDNSKSLATGSIYVTDVAGGGEHEVIDRFKLSGLEYKYEGQVNGEPPRFIEPIGAATDSSGDVYVSDFGTHEVREFQPASTMEIARFGIGENPQGIAVDSQGDIFVQEYIGHRLYEAKRSSDTATSIAEPVVVATGATAVAIDRVTNSLYVDFGAKVVEYSLETGSPIEVAKFGEGTIKESLGVAVDEARGKIYMTDAGPKKGYIFELAPALPKFLLTVSDTGTGKGTVSSEPYELGINCEPLNKESKCTEELEEKTKVKLTARPAAATPAVGFKFVKWSGGPCEGSEAPTCEFEMPSNATEVKAEFAEVPKFLVTVADTGAGKGTVSSEPAGIKCESVVPLSKCTEGFEEKTKVKLTATPAGGSKFVKWSGGACEGSEAPTCEFKMPGKATEVKAQFAELPTVWLCKPGLANNPCESDLTTTVELPNGSSFVKHSKPAKNPPIDCFYLYPQVSSQNTLNANLEIDPEQTQVAIDQASRFSQVCKVYAPMYPQFTGLGALFEGITPGGATIAYDGALAAWRYYLANYNHGRGVVLIGHSLGASTLKQLIKEQIDPNRSLRHRLVSADLLGGQVTVPVGKDVGGDFQHVAACHAAWQTGCVVAYSSFLKEPPEPSYLGRVASPYFKTEPNPSLQILCVNPAALFGGDQSGRSEGDALGGSHGEHSMPSHGDQSGLLLPYQSTSPFPGFLGPFWQVAKASTPWVSTPGQYSAQCKQANGASWLQLTERPFTGPLPDEVQKLTVSGTSGEILLLAPEGRGGGAIFGFNATHEEVQTALEEPEGEYDKGRVKVFGSPMFGKGNVQVTGGPGDEKGTKPYVITFTGSLAHQPVPLLETFSFVGETTATVVEVTHGVNDPRLQIAETIGPEWGTHLLDVNIALGNLVGLTAVQSWAYQAHGHGDHS